MNKVEMENECDEIIASVHWLLLAVVMLLFNATVVSESDSCASMDEARFRGNNHAFHAFDIMTPAHVHSCSNC